MSKRRTAYRKGLLTSEQIRSLEALPGWTWSPRDDDFQRAQTLLRAFVKRAGHAAVPLRHVERGINLGTWVASRRADHARGRLPRDRTRALEALRGWSWRLRDDRFEAALAALRGFAKREGHARVPYSHCEGKIRLGHWLDSMRQAHAQGRLGRDRARRVEGLPGWTWHARNDLFHEGMRILTRFVKREGHARVPAAHVERGFRLGPWVVNRRNERHRGKLARDRATTLEKLPGWTWNTREASFDTGYRHLQLFVKREGHARVPSDHSERGFPLGRWVHKSRQRRAGMAPERTRLLTAFPGWAWNRYDWQFRKALRQLRTFANREGHARVSAQHVERGFRLGAWVSHCRSRRSALGKDRRRALEAIPGWVWTVPSQRGTRNVESVRRPAAPARS